MTQSFEPAPMQFSPSDQGNQNAASQESTMAQERLSQEATTAKRNVLETAVHGAVGVVTSSESDTRHAAESTAAEFVKAVPLFIGGGRGLLLSTVAFGLGEVKVGDSLQEQGVQLVSGMAKGFLTKKTFEVFGAKDWGFAKKGMAMGSSSRLIDAGLTPANYYFDGKLDLQRGAKEAVMNAGDLKALGVDVATFGVAHFIPGALSGTKAARSAIITTSLTGATFGFTSGVLGELQTQWHNNQSTDFTKLLTSGGKEAALMAAAAATGHKLTARPRVAPAGEQQDNRSEPKDPRPPKDPPPESTAKTVGPSKLDNLKIVDVHSALTQFSDARPASERAFRNSLEDINSSNGRSIGIYGHELAIDPMLKLGDYYPKSGHNSFVRRAGTDGHESFEATPTARGLLSPDWLRQAILDHVRDNHRLRRSRYI